MHVHQFLKSRLHLSLAIALGIVIAVVLPPNMPGLRRFLLAWDGAVWFFLASMLWVVWHTTPARVRAIAVAQDETAGLVLMSLTVATIASISAIVSELSQLGQASTAERIGHYGFSALTVLGSWFLLGLIYAFHYAHLYYTRKAGPAPLDFPDTNDNPDYWDFLYFSFTISVAAQTADVRIQTRAMRRVVLGQAILSFLFNMTILGLSVNIAAGLLNG